ncbi:MAG: hypothetical protein ACK5GN_03520 [Pseudomonadota bacterium]|jgi:hypothetical protein
MFDRSDLQKEIEKLLQAARGTKQGSPVDQPTVPAVAPDAPISEQCAAMALAKELFTKGNLPNFFDKYGSYPDILANLHVIMGRKEGKYGLGNHFSPILLYRDDISMLKVLLTELAKLESSRVVDHVLLTVGSNAGPFSRQGKYGARQSEQDFRVALTTAINVCSQFEEAVGGQFFKYNRFELIETVVRYSSEVRHDLLIVNGDKYPQKGLTAQSLAEYYAQGHRYIGHQDTFGSYDSEYQEKNRKSDAEVALRNHIARLKHYPSFELQEKYVPILLEAPDTVRRSLVDLLGHFSSQRAPFAYYESVVVAVKNSNLDEEQLMGLVRSLSRFKDDALISGCLLLDEMARIPPADLQVLQERFEVGDFGEIERELYRGKLEAHQRKFPEKPLEERLAAFRIGEHPDSEPPPEALLTRAAGQYAKIVEGAHELAQLPRLRIPQMIRELVERTPIPERYKEPFRVEYLALSRELFKRHYGVYPYNTQILAILMMTDEQFLSESGGEGPARGVYSQIKTGEGKSLLFAMLAGYQAILEQKVDVITSNDYLAERDARRFRPFFSDLGLSCDSFSFERTAQGNKERKTDVHDPNPSILYSTNQSMIFDLLSSKLNGFPFKNGRSHDCILIDEADNLCLDLTSESCRIATPKPRTFDESFLKACVEFTRVYGVNGIYQKPAEAAAEFFVRNPQAREIHPVILGLYLQSAVKSGEVREGLDYVIRDKRIVIVDQGNTGRLMERSHWGHGLHDFVAMKHNLPLPDSTGISAYMSHPAYIKQYSKILCISGTMGDSTDRRELRQLYNLVGFDTPTHHKSVRVDEPLKVYLNRDSLSRYMLQVLRDLTRGEKKRPVVILTSSIGESVEVHKLLQNEGFAAQLLNDYTNQDDLEVPRLEQEIIDRAGKAGRITVATEVSGRGADIIPDEEATESGGIYVIMTGISQNSRVEYQGRGRAGRQGKAGTSTVIASIDQDLFIHKLSPAEQQIIIQIASRYGPDSQEIQGTIEFMRRARNVCGSIARLSELRTEETAQRVMNRYFTKLANGALELAARNSIIAAQQGLGRYLIGLYLSDAWSEKFDELDAVLKHSHIMGALSDIDVVSSIGVKSLVDVFDRCFGAAPDQFAEGDEYLQALKYLFQNYAGTILDLERRAAAVNAEEIEKLIDRLNQEVDALTDTCLGELGKASAWDINRIVCNKREQRNTEGKS